MNRMIKVILALALSIILIITTSILVNAHTTKQEDILEANHYVYSGWYIGSESIGWSIDENYHNGSSVLYFKWLADPCLTTTLKAHYLRGAQKWFPCGRVTENSSLAKGTFGTFNLGASSDIVAIFYNCYSDDLGHLTHWEISMNRGKSYSDAKWAAILAHEMGHAYGLNDLYDDSNKDKLMYGYDSGTATGPTSSDVKGFDVITGRHSNHSFNSSGVCTVCGGSQK